MESEEKNSSKRWIIYPVLVLAVALGIVLLAPLFFDDADAQAFDDGYTKKQMKRMHEVISGSRKIINQEFGFRIEIPGGFKPVKKEKFRPRSLYEYQMIQDDGVPILIRIERLKRTISREMFEDEFYKKMRMTVPEGVQISISQEQWGDYTLDVTQVIFYIQDQEVLMRTVMVPLAGEAVKIDVRGAPQHEEKCAQLLRDLLKGLKGKSNWST